MLAAGCEGWGVGIGDLRFGIWDLGFGIGDMESGGVGVKGLRSKAGTYDTRLTVLVF